MEKVTFDMAGSPCMDLERNITVGPVIDRFIQRGTAPFYLGPFRTAKERYVAFFDNALQQIRDGTRTLPQHTLVDYLTAIELKSLVMGCSELDQGPWYIKHGEDKGDHIMVHEEGVVTAVLDWEW